MLITEFCSYCAAHLRISFRICENRFSHYAALLISIPFELIGSIVVRHVILEKAKQCGSRIKLDFRPPEPKAGSQGELIVYPSSRRPSVSLSVHFFL